MGTYARWIFSLNFFIDAYLHKIPGPLIQYELLHVLIITNIIIMSIVIFIGRVKGLLSPPEIQMVLRFLQIQSIFK